MKLKYAFIGTVAGLSLLWTSAPALAQSAQNGIGQVAKVNDVYGKKVISSDSKTVGKLNNVVVDLESGRILYGVVGTRQGRVAVAPGIFTETAASKNEWHVKATAAKIDRAPKFTTSVDKPGQWGQASFVDQVYNYFGQRPWWQGSTAANVGTFHDVHKASHLLGIQVVNAENQPLGKIDNVMVDLPAGRVVYMILSPASSLNLGDNLYVLPPQAFTFGPPYKHLVSGINTQKLQGAPHFAANSWPSDLSSTTFASQVYHYFGKQPYFQTTQPTGR
jgi:sporulation protein YlmC with PRC-barrel domain